MSAKDHVNTVISLFLYNVIHVVFGVRCTFSVKVPVSNTDPFVFAISSRFACNPAAGSLCAQAAALTLSRSEFISHCSVICHSFPSTE